MVGEYIFYSTSDFTEEIRDELLRRIYLENATNSPEYEDANKQAFAVKLSSRQYLLVTYGVFKDAYELQKKHGQHQIFVILNMYPKQQRVIIDWVRIYEKESRKCSS
jgi:hypothetical protein